VFDEEESSLAWSSWIPFVPFCLDCGVVVVDAVVVVVDEEVGDCKGWILDCIFFVGVVDVDVDGDRGERADDETIEDVLP